MPKPVDLPIGSKVGILTVTSDPFKKNNLYYVSCKCDCGNTKDIQKRSLTCPDESKRTKSCGCLQRQSASVIKTEIPIGKKFSLLKIIEDMGTVKDSENKSRRMVRAVCDCGNETVARWDGVSCGKTKSCGCLQPIVVSEASKTHGMSDTPTHDSWTAMKQRCNNPNSRHYENYGGRGITYDPRWESFENFLEDMGERPEGMTLDRIDFNGNYTKENCRWESGSVQVHNQRKRATNGKYEVTSIFKGVYFDKFKNKWAARLNHNGEILLRKRYETELEAAMAYDEVSYQAYGDRPNKTILETERHILKELEDGSSC